MNKLTEQDLAKKVVTTLRDVGWEIYQEVETGFGRADIIARNKKITWVIECKMSFSISVIEQAWNHVRANHAHYVSVAVPQGKTGWFAKDICEKYGIGVLRVNMKGGEHGIIDESAKPRLNRKAKTMRLHRQQKTYCAAGSAKGGHWTPFKDTREKLVGLVKKMPKGIEFQEAIKKIDHHYSSFSSAKSCLLGFIGTVIPELRAKNINGKLMVFYVEQQTEQEKI